MKHEPSAADTRPPAPVDGAPGIAGHALDDAPSGIAREYHNLLSDLEDLLAATRASIGNLGGEIAKRARTGATVTDNYVRAQPWQAIGISAGVGVLIGYLLGRGRRDS